ncbi:MAG: TlpA disulfide reductase family protein [Chloroflexota bacterium]
MKRILRTALVIVLLVAGLAAAGCSVGTDRTDIPVPGRTAPDFQLQSLGGETVSLSGLRGQPVMVNFWASWCGPCREEMPFIQKVYEDTTWKTRGLVILAVNLAESPAEVQKFMDALGLSFTVLLDSQQEVGKLYNVSAIPTTYFIDKNGIIRDVKIGSFQSVAEIDAKLQKLVAENGS